MRDSIKGTLHDKGAGVELLNTANNKDIPQMVAFGRGLYARVARKIKCDPSYVSRVARGERHSVRIGKALNAEVMTVLARIAKQRRRRRANRLR